MPASAASETQNLSGFRSPHKILQSQLHRGGVGACPAQPLGVQENLLIKHEICTFHVWTVHRDAGRSESNDRWLSGCS